MGVQLSAKGVDAEQYATEYSAPVRRGLEGIFFLNTSLTKSPRNYASGKPQGTVVGAPVPSAVALAVKSRVNYVQTQISESAEMTIFIVCKTASDGSVTADRPMFFSNYQGINADGGAAFGLSFYLGAGTRLTFGGGYGTDAASNTQKLAGITKAGVANSWALFSMSVGASGVTIRDHTAGGNGTISSAGLPRRTATAKIRIGSGITSFDGSADIAAFQAYSVELSDLEISTTAEDLRGYMARKGILV